MTKIIQCKYWSKNKEIHEKHIAQLYGSLIHYCIVNGKSIDEVKGDLYTTTVVSKMGKDFANILGIGINENIPIGDFPRIKCNINKDCENNETKIYHLPMDQQYDRTLINQPGEMYAYSVYEAEKNGFRRAWRYRGEKDC